MLTLTCPSCAPSCIASTRTKTIARVSPGSISQIDRSYVRSFFKYVAPSGCNSYSVSASNALEWSRSSLPAGASDMKSSGVSTDVTVSGVACGLCTWSL